MTPPAVAIDDALLRDWPLPMPQPDADKEARGRIVVVGGSRELAGAVRLAATAALRVGAGKLVIATAAVPLAVAMPEARVIGLPETAAGGLLMVPALADALGQAAAAVVGPGLMDRSSLPLVQAVLDSMPAGPLVLDALAMDVLKTCAPLAAPALLTPHAGEMAHLSGRSKDAVQADPAAAARAAAAQSNALVVLKGATTWIAAPDGRLWQHAAGHAGLATSGSGDVLAGVIGGLLARGASPEQAGAWGVALHARAGERVGRRMGTLGFLARELPAELPGLLQGLCD